MTTVTEKTDGQQLTAAELVQRYLADVWRYLRYLGCGESQADDLTQETFLAVIRKPPEFRSDTESAAYLRKVARNQLLMTVRRQKRKPMALDLEVAETVWAEAVGEKNNEYFDALDDCLEQLHGRAREAVDMCYRSGQSRREMAEALEMTEDGVKTLLRRTRTTLRRCIERKLEREQ